MSGYAELYDDYVKLLRLHEIATERTVQLSAVIEKAQDTLRWSADKEDWPGWNVLECLTRILGTADTDAALREVRAKAWGEGFDRAYGAARNWGHTDMWEWEEPEDNPYLNPYLNPYREDT